MHLDGHVSGGYHYYYVAQSLRKGQEVSKDRVLYLGRLDNIDEIRRLEIERQIRDLGDPELLIKFRSLLYSLGYRFPSPFSTMTVEEVYDLGLPLALHKVCEDIQLVEIVDNHGYKGGGPPLGKIVEIMAIHRNCDPGSHRELVKWYPTTTLPAYLALPPEKFTHKGTLNALDYLQPDYTIPMQMELYDNIRSVYGYECERLDIDITSSYFEGWNCLLAKFGHSRDNRSDRPQIVIGFIVDNEGILVTHKVWPGNRTDSKSLKPLDRVLREQFGLDCPRVMDRGFATWENLNYMDRKKERYLVALRAKVKSTGLLDDIKIPKSKWEDVSEGLVAASVVEGRRKYIVGWNESVANTNRRARLSRVKKAEEGLRIVQKRIKNGKIKSRKERDEEIGHVLKENKVKRFFDIKRNRKGFSFQFIKNEKLTKANKFEGYQVFVTTEMALTEKDVIMSYRARDEVEKAIGALKNALALRPMYVWTKEHVIGQIFICAQAYQIRSIFDLKLRRSGMGLSLNEALWKLERLKAVNIIATGDEIRVIRKLTSMDKEQLALIDIFNMSDAIGGLLSQNKGI